jgi:putative ABC transport system substrate-binding protein
VNRRRIVIVLGSALAFMVRPSLAQKTEALPKIGLLWINSATTPLFVASLREGLRARGYEVGRDVNIDDRSLVAGYEGLAAAAERLAREKVSVILAFGTTAVQTAQKAAPATPIVMVAAGDPVRLGVAASLSRPGGNVTGFTTVNQDLSGKRLELLTQLVPSMRRFAVVLYPGSASEADSLRNYELLARSLQLEAVPVEIRGNAEIEPAIAGIAQMNVQAIVVVASTLFAAHRERMIAAVARIRIPAVYSQASIAEAGGLIAFSPDVQENFYRAAVYIDKILRGAKPGDLAIEQASKWLLIVNRKTARTLGLKLPQSILSRADQVLE